MRFMNILNNSGLYIENYVSPQLSFTITKTVVCFNTQNSVGELRLYKYTWTFIKPISLKFNYKKIAVWTIKSFREVIFTPLDIICHIFSCCDQTKKRIFGCHNSRGSHFNTLRALILWNRSPRYSCYALENFRNARHTASTVIIFLMRRA